MALSLMIESPSLMRPLPSLVFLPPQAGKGEGIGLIPWAEVLHVSFVCACYVAIFSNVRGHLVAGIEMRILNKLLSRAHQGWRALGSLLLRTCNLYIGSMTLMFVLDLISDRDDKLEMMLDEFNAEQARQPPASGVGLGGGKLGEGIGTVTMLSGSDRYAWSDTMSAGSDGGPPRGPRSSSLPVPVTQQR